MKVADVQPKYFNSRVPSEAGTFVSTFRVMEKSVSALHHVYFVGQMFGQHVFVRLLHCSSFLWVLAAVRSEPPSLRPD